MKKNILITGIMDSRNNGCWVMIASAAEGIRSISPVSISFKTLTSKTSIDRQRLGALNIEPVVSPWTRLNIRKVNVLYRWGCFIILPLLALFYRAIRAKSSVFSFWKAFLEADLIVDLSGDSLSADYPDYSLASNALPLVITRILNKPYMLCAQSIGPFKKTFIQDILIALIRDASVISTRERITDDILSNLHIHGNVILAQDLAFSMKPAGKERIDEICAQEGIDPRLPWVGVSVSDLISAYSSGELSPAQRKESYIGSMAAFSDWIIDTYGFNILFVPHVVIPNVGNDLAITRDIFNRMKFRDKAAVLIGVYNGDELKGIIGICKLFVGSRMHATIGALSQRIPTMTYVYNHKTIGINGRILRQHDYLIDIRAIRHAELLERSREVFIILEKNAAHISSLLTDILPEIIEGSKSNAWSALNLLEIAGPLSRMSNPKLCTGCGACVAACSVGALRMGYTPEGTLRPRLAKDCSGCGRCKRSCPVLGFDIDEEERLTFGVSAKDPETGVVTAAYAGYAKDRELRRRATSGGLVPSILAHLIESGGVDAVLSIVDDPEAPLRPKASWITSVEELHGSTGSRYTPVSPLAALRDLPDELSRIALVGLPCHLWGLRLLEKNGFLGNRQIVLKLGLFCGCTPSGHAIEIMLGKNGIQPRDVTKLSYRGNGWPGGLTVKTRNGEVFYPQKEIWPFLSSPYFRNRHCFFCKDFFSYLSDLSFGDAWLPEYKGDADGWSLCLVRSAAGQKVLEECAERLHLEEAPMAEVKKATSGNIETKYRQGVLKESIFPKYSRIRRGRIPGTPRPSYAARAMIRFGYSLSNIGKHRTFQHAFLDHPLNRFMKINNRILSILNSRSGASES